MAKSVVLSGAPPLMTADSPPASAFVRALGELGHGVLLLEGDRIVDASEAFSALVGYDRDTLLALPSALDLAIESDRPRLRDLLARHGDGESVGRRFGLRVNGANGNILDLEVALIPVTQVPDLASQPPRFFVLVHDVTETTDYHRQVQFQSRLMEAIAETSLDGVLVVDRDGAMSYFNRRFVDMWALPELVVGGRRDEDSLRAVQAQLVDPEEFAARVAYLYAHPLEESRDDLRLRDGRVVERFSAPILDRDGTPRARVWFFRDVTETSAGMSASELLAVSGELFGTSLDAEKTLSQLVEVVVPRIADWAAVDVIDETDSFKRIGVAHIDPNRAVLLRELHDRYPLRPNEGKLRGRVVATREPIALYDVDDVELRTLARDDDHFEMLRTLGIRSAMWLPLIVRDRVVGVLSAGYQDAQRRYTPSDLNLLKELARRAALAVDNALLYRAVKRGETRQAAIASMGQQALAGIPYSDLAQLAGDLLAQIMDVPYVEVLQAQDDETLLLVAGIGWHPGLVGKATVKAGLGSQGGYTLDTVGPVVLDDLATETRFQPPGLLVDHGVVSGVTVVVGGTDRPYGVLGAHTNFHRVFAEDDVNFLQAVANVLAAAIVRQQNEDRLNSLASAEQARAAQLKAVIESIGDAVVVTDVLGVVLLANPAAEHLVGERLAHGLAGILTSFEWPQGRASGEIDAGESLELRIKANVEQWIELSVFPVLGGESGTAAGGTVLVMRDVTAARSARSVREAFLGILSHELRTPVTTIYGGAEMLARRAGKIDEASRREVYEDIRSEADRLYRLVENLLVLSRVERQGLQIDTEPVLLQRLIPRVIEAEAARWHNIKLESVISMGLPPVAAEETYLEQILRNLFGNAAKYAGERGIVIRADDMGSSVRVTVADSGPGFPEEEGDKLFDLFYRSPSVVRTAAGAGIGLFVSRQLVNALDGRIWARNLPEGGAEFGFEVPVFLD